MVPRRTVTNAGMWGAKRWTDSCSKPSRLYQATAVAAFSTRARVGAPVSAPLFWRELDSCRGDSFNVKNVLSRLQQLKSDPWADWEAARRPVSLTMRKKLAA